LYKQFSGIWDVLKAKESDESDEEVKFKTWSRKEIMDKKKRRKMRELK